MNPIKRTAKYLAALALATVTVVGAGAEVSSAASTHSVKVCGVNYSKKVAETGATVYSYYWTGSAWKRYSSAAVGSGGCAWVSAPKGYYTYYQIYRAPALGFQSNTCWSLGYLTYDSVNTDVFLIPTTQDGFNAGSYYVYFGTISCY